MSETNETPPKAIGPPTMLGHVDGDGLPSVPFDKPWSDMRCTYCGKTDFPYDEVCEARVKAEEKKP